MNFLNKKKTQLNSISKLLQLLLFLLAMSFSTISIAQTKKQPVKTDTTKVKKDNLLDMQAEFLTSTFGENLDGKSNGKKISFLELLDKMNLPADQKAEYKNQYYLQAKDLSEKQKDSLGRAIEIKIKKAQQENTKN